MKIGIICNREKKKGIMGEKICDFGAVELYRIDVGGKKRKRISKHLLKRIAKAFIAEGISLCVADGEMSGLVRYGITVVDNGNDVILERSGQAAMLFSEANGIDADFLIDGGGFSNVCSAALFLLQKKRHVYINNPAFFEISEEILCETGAVVSCDAPKETVRIQMNGSREFIKYKELSAEISDFKAEIEGLGFSWLSERKNTALISILEKSGFLEKNRVKIEYFLK